MVDKIATALPLCECARHLHLGRCKGTAFAKIEMHVSLQTDGMQTQQRVADKASTSEAIKGFVDNYMESSRQSSSEYSTKVLAKASALSKRPKHELAAVGTAAAAAAATAWWAAAPKSQAKKTEDVSRSGASSSLASGASAAQGTEQKGSWMGTLAWAAQAATAAYAAGSAASKTVSAAGDIAQFLSPEGVIIDYFDCGADLCVTPNRLIVHRQLRSYVSIYSAAHCNTKSLFLCH